MDKDNNTLRPGDVVQIAPTADAIFGGHFLVVMDLRPDGVEGVVALPGEVGQPTRAAIVFVTSDDCKRIGRAGWEAARGAAPERAEVQA